MENTAGHVGDLDVKREGGEIASEFKSMSHQDIQDYFSDYKQKNRHLVHSEANKKTKQESENYPKSCLSSSSPEKAFNTDEEMQSEISEDAMMIDGTPEGIEIEQTLTLKEITAIRTYNRPTFNLKPSVKVQRRTTPNVIPQAASSEIILEAISEISLHDHVPVSSSKLLGNTNQINKLKNWLVSWSVKSNYKSSLVSGSPGIGKTTAVRLICKELGYSLIEMNASDTRNKTMIADKVRALCFNTTISGYNSIGKGVLIMDEVDGMSSGDQGGVTALIEILKITRIPIICICNDRYATSIRTLAKKCLDIKMNKPHPKDLLTYVSEINRKEMYGLSQTVLSEIVDAAQGDIRQTFQMLYSVLISPSRDLALGSKDKYVSFSPSQAASSLFDNKLSFQDKVDLVMVDYDLIPMIAYENYTDACSDIRKAAIASRSCALGDVFMSEIRTNQEWSLLPDYTLHSSILPLAFASSVPTIVSFPTILGNQSSISKKNRLMQELGQSTFIRDEADLFLEQIVQMANEEEFDELKSFCDYYRLTWELIQEHLCILSAKDTVWRFKNLDNKLKKKMKKLINNG